MRGNHLTEADNNHCPAQGVGTMYRQTSERELDQTLKRLNEPKKVQWLLVRGQFDEPSLLWHG